MLNQELTTLPFMLIAALFIICVSIIIYCAYLFDVYMYNRRKQKEEAEIEKDQAVSKEADSHTAMHELYLDQQYYFYRNKVLDLLNTPLYDIDQNHVKEVKMILKDLYNNRDIYRRDIKTFERFSEYFEFIPRGTEPYVLEPFVKVYHYIYHNPECVEAVYTLGHHYCGSSFSATIKNSLDDNEYLVISNPKTGSNRYVKEYSAREPFNFFSGPECKVLYLLMKTCEEKAKMTKRIKARSDMCKKLGVDYK